eukprot:7070058-Prymnesium_polylepis.1
MPARTGARRDFRPPRAHAWPPRGARACVLTGYEDAAHEHGTRARRANNASGVPRRGRAPSRRQHSVVAQLRQCTGARGGRVI